MTHTGSRYNTVPKSAQQKSDTVQNTSEVTHVHTHNEDRLYVTAGDWNAAGLEPGTLSSEPEKTNDVADVELKSCGTDQERSRDQPKPTNDVADCRRGPRSTNTAAARTRNGHGPGTLSRPADEPLRYRTVRITVRSQHTSGR